MGIKWGDVELTQPQLATLKALAESCGYSLNSHVPLPAILHRVPTQVQRDAKKSVKWLLSKGLCKKHPTGGETTYNITPDALLLARNLWQ